MKPVLFGHDYATSPGILNELLMAEGEETYFFLK